MSNYQRLQSTSTRDNDVSGEGGNMSITTNTRIRTNVDNNQTLHTTDRANDSSSNSNSSNNHTNNNNNNNNSSSSSNSSSNSLSSRSSAATSSWEYSPFDSVNTNKINQTNISEMPKIATPTTTTMPSTMTSMASKVTATTTSTTTTMNLVDVSSKTSSTSLLLDGFDADDTTMEVPLLGDGRNNNNVAHHDHGNHQFSSASGTAADDAVAAAATCYCQLPGFNSNLHTKSTRDAKFKILLAIILCCIFMIVEFLGGYMAGSLAIMTDAAHLASDCISFVIGLVAIWLGGRPPDKRMSFGYKRMEVMGAVISILGIWILTATLIMVAIERLYSNDFDLNANTMMIIAGIGILINIIMVSILHGSSLEHNGAHGHSHSHTHAHSHSHTSHASAAADNTLLQMNGSNGSDNELKHANKCDTDENLNLRAAMIHVIGDLVQSIGVFFASIMIKIYPYAKFADPLCTLLFSVIVFMTTVRLFRESVGILLDAVPARISLNMLARDLFNIDGVKSVHHLNVWSHTNNYSIMMVHLVIDFLSDSNTILQRATQIACSPKYDIKHCTIQIERLTTT